MKKEDRKDGEAERWEEKTGKMGGGADLYGTLVRLYTVWPHHKARESPWLSTDSLILLVPVREYFLATLVNLAMVAHLANAGFSHSGLCGSQDPPPFAYLVLREIKGPWNYSHLLGVPLLVRRSHFWVWPWRSLHTLASPSLAGFHW